MPADPQHIPVKLTQDQRRVVAEIIPEPADRLKRAERNHRAIQFTLAELRAVKEKAEKAIRQAGTGVVRNSLRHVTDLMAQASTAPVASVPSPTPGGSTSSGSPCSTPGPRSGGAS